LRLPVNWSNCASGGLIMKILMLAAMVASTAALVAPVAAQDDLASKASTCSAIADSLARLTCFDKVFPAGADVANPPAANDQAEAPEPPTTASPWIIEASKSAIDDSPSITALLLPIDQSGTGIGGCEIAIMLRCVENTTSVVISTNMFMIPDNISVTTRLDDEPAQTSKWGRSTSYKAVGLWNGAKAIPFVRELAKASKLVVRVQDSDRVDGEFDLGDVRSVAQQVADACGWNLGG